MKKVLIFGAGGMAGHVLKNYLKDTGRYELYSTYNTQSTGPGDYQVNIVDTKKVQELLNTIKPDIIVNCIGTLIKNSIEFPDKAIFTNAYFPHFLAGLVKKSGAKIIHISTDCVFSGKRGKYEETDAKDANDLYGSSKALGELTDSQNLTIRTSIIGPELKTNGEGLFHWFMLQKGNISGYTNVWWSGVTTLELAKFIDYIIDKPTYGLMHFTNGTPINKFQLLSLFAKNFGRNDVEIHENGNKHSDKSLVPSMKAIEYKVPSYDDMLSQMHAFMEKNKGIYKLYAHNL